MSDIEEYLAIVLGLTIGPWFIILVMQTVACISLNLRTDYKCEPIKKRIEYVFFGHKIACYLLEEQKP